MSPGLCYVDASVLTLASSSKRVRRRNSLDTNASMLAIALSSRRDSQVGGQGVLLRGIARSGGRRRVMGRRRCRLGMRRWRRKFLINGVRYGRLCNIWASIYSVETVSYSFTVSRLMLHLNGNPDRSDLVAFASAYFGEISDKSCAKSEV
jgi:hypothetical protein